MGGSKGASGVLAGGKADMMMGEGAGAAGEDAWLGISCGVE